MTLIEMMVVIAILAIFMAFVFQNIMNTRRIAAIEDVRLNMDTAANNVLRTVSLHVKEAVLPVHAIGTCGEPGNRNLPDFTRVLNSTSQGFGSNAVAWERRLINGANFIAFCTPVDADGSGDKLDGSLYPYLGISHPSSFSFVSNGKNKSKNEITSAAYTNYILDSGTSINPGLAALPPDTIQQKDTPPTANLIPKPTPVVPNGAYAIIRFVPLLRSDGTPMIVHEGADTGGPERGLQCDINGDDVFDKDLQYYIGNIEIIYPAVKGKDLESGLDFDYAASSRQLGTMNMVAVPVVESRPSGNLDGWNSQLFTLVSLDENGAFVEVNPTGSHDRFVFDSLRIQLTLVNFNDRDNIRVGDPDHPGGAADITQNKFHTPGMNVTAKRYEGLVRLRNM